MKDPQPQWDVLIIDEASKTTFQQFIIPAAFSKRWILVGDVRQLPPFLETSELMTNLDQMKDDEGKPFTPAAQRACLLLRQLRYVRQAPKIPIVLVEPNEVPRMWPKNWKQEKNSIAHDLISPSSVQSALRRVHSEFAHLLTTLNQNTISRCWGQTSSSLEVTLTIEWQNISPPYAVFRPGRYELSAVSDSRVARLRDLTGYDVKKGPIALATEELNHDWSHEVSWRLNRAYELKVSKNQKARQNWESQINDLLPVSQNVEQRIEEVRSIALPSVLECLQDGFADGRGRELL